jgi:hypothetical protein
VTEMAPKVLRLGSHTGGALHLPCLKTPSMRCALTFSPSARAFSGYSQSRRESPACATPEKMISTRNRFLIDYTFEPKLHILTTASIAATSNGSSLFNAPEGSDMHHSRLCAVLIDCRTSDVDEAARFWGEALGRPVDSNHPSSRGNYRMLETPPDEPIVEIQRVDHESRMHIDIETDDISAEVERLAKLGAKVVDRLERWVVMEAPTGQRFCVVRVQRPGFPKNANHWD